MSTSSNQKDHQPGRESHAAATTGAYRPISLKKAFEIKAADRIGQCRAIPVKMGNGAKKAFLAIYSPEFDIDPYVEMFYFPESTLKLMLFDQSGAILWERDLGKGVVPGVWFCPVTAFDLNGDGVDEIWFVNNRNTNHPLGVSGYTLTGLDALTHEIIQEIPWPHTDVFMKMPLSHQFRNFIVGGYAHGEPVLVAAQGTYSDMCFECFGKDMKLRWEKIVKAEDAGARGSHMCPVIDFNHDGVDELLWGERFIELANGTELCCLDKETYSGHSDIIQPIYNNKLNQWNFLTCRESDPEAAPRICYYDALGNRLWGDLESGHIDLGWAARLAEDQSHYVMGVRIGNKVCGPDGRFHDSYEEFVYRPADGKRVELGFSVYKTIPVDLNGDGFHELVRGLPSANGEVLDRTGKVLGNVGGSVALSGKLLEDQAGEHLLTYGEDGTLAVWYDENARDSAEAVARYHNPFYEKALRLLGNGYHWPVLGGI